MGLRVGLILAMPLRHIGISALAPEASADVFSILAFVLTAGVKMGSDQQRVYVCAVTVASIHPHQW